MRKLIVSILLVAATAVYAQNPTEIFKEGKRYGLRSASGEVIVAPTYKKIKDLGLGMYAVGDDFDQGLMDENGNMISEITHRTLKPFNENGVAPIRLPLPTNEDKVVNVIQYAYAAINTKGELLFEPTFEKIEEYNEFDIAIFIKEDKKGLVDATGKVVLPAEYDKIDEMYGDKNHYKIVIGDNHGLATKQGELVVKPIYQSIGKFSCSCPGQDGSIATFKRDDKYGFMDTNYTEILPPTYDEASRFINGLATVKKGELWGYLNRDFEMEIDFQFDNASGFFDDELAVVVKDGKYCFIQKDGSIYLETDYDFLEDFNDGLAAVRKGKKYGYINKEGELVIPMDYTYASDFYKGEAWVYIKKKKFKIDTKGNVIEEK